MKKLVTLLAIISLSFAACGGSENTGETEETTTSPETEVSAPATNTTVDSTNTAPPTAPTGSSDSTIRS